MQQEEQRCLGPPEQPRAPSHTRPHPEWLRLTGSPNTSAFRWGREKSRSAPVCLEVSAQGRGARPHSRRGDSVLAEHRLSRALTHARSWKVLPDRRAAASCWKPSALGCSGIGGQGVSGPPAGVGVRWSWREVRTRACLCPSPAEAVEPTGGPEAVCWPGAPRPPVGLPAFLRL